ncbi:S8 family serine peptidase [Bailinhaonella thermotolerans]|uniref:Peptidase S8 n=1 Tax=Bailinhaonella thermotolerans TaxID=1070861 RepID=A0A3A4APQ3_9ACTN|nr:S8 family serine peptidase [Bailinhaonella thermotolerans]RJL30415.1 peptidase S8 [Bailinhaonella thermotolerans]
MRALINGLLAAALAAGTLALTPAAHAGPANAIPRASSAGSVPGPAAPPPATGGPAVPKVRGQVTLITGDLVTVSESGHRAEPGPGRTVDFHTQVSGGHLYVIPSDALRLVASGVLDRRLFAVTQLLTWRYGDADRSDIPLIAQGAAAAPRSARAVRPMGGLGLTALRVPKQEAGRAWQELAAPRALAAGRGKLWLDGRREFTLDRSTAQIGATTAWKQGVTGAGVTVAVLDTGYDPSHPDLKDVVSHAKNFSEEPDVSDTFGHGTHVASIVAGAGEKHRGVAPGAKLAVGKVGGQQGASDSAIIAGMDWAVSEAGAKVVNLSLGAPDSPGLDPVEQAVNTLSQRTGALFVVAAGNSGESSPASSPGSADAALTVGAVDREDRVTAFSSGAPREGDHAIKPDLTAPGQEISAALPGGGHGEMSGTSMSSPHVAGAAALLAQLHPDWTGARLKAALTGTAAPTAGVSPYRQGTGRVDLVRALGQRIVAETDGAWAAFPWDGPGGRTATKAITYVNTGESPVTLDLSAEGEVIALAARRVEVPAGGRAQVTVTIDATGKAPGDYPGIITARAGETVVRTVAGAYVEPESYDVTITALDSQGAPAEPWAQVYHPESGAFRDLVFQGGEAKVRLTEGDWRLHAEVREDQARITIASTAFTVKDATSRVTVDARRGRQVRSELDDPTAERGPAYQWSLAEGGWGASMVSMRGGIGRLHVIPARRPGLRYAAHTSWFKKGATPSPYRYDLVDRRDGEIPEDPVIMGRRRDLTTVTAVYRASGVAATGLEGSGPVIPGWLMNTTTPNRDRMELPATITHHRTPGFDWTGALVVGAMALDDPVRRARSGREEWNVAVSGPAFASGGEGRTGDASRTGDRIAYTAGPFFSDGVRGRLGLDDAATGTIVLSRDGREIARADLAGCGRRPRNCRIGAEVPAGEGDYTLSTVFRRQVAHSALSTSVESVWTFRSGTTPEERPLPLMAVRYAPGGLDSHNRARAGSLVRVPLWVERNPGAPRSAVRSLTLEASGDDGATWRRVPAVRTGDGWTALVRSPAAPGFVSLRATVKDASGAGVTQTILRAYAVR